MTTRSMTPPPAQPLLHVVTEKGNGTLEIFPIEPSEAVLFELFEDLFGHHWQQIHFGPLVQGAVFEIRVTAAPEKISMLDGYLTVDFGTWHFHVCIGEHKGSRNHPVDSELAHHRRTARAELYRRINQEGTPDSWGIRLFNGKDEQQITIFLPNPFLSDEMAYLKEPDWSRLALWDMLRKKYLGLDPDPRDRSARRFIHG